MGFFDNVVSSTSIPLEVLMQLFPGKLNTRFYDNFDLADPCAHSEVLEILIHQYGLQAASAVQTKLKSSDKIVRAYAAFFFVAVPFEPAVSDLVELLNDDEIEVVKYAAAAISAYYFYPNIVLMIGGPPYREEIKRNIESWRIKFKDKSRPQILLARLDEQPSQWLLENIRDILPRDEAINYLIDWALSSRKERVWAFFTLFHLMGIKFFSTLHPDEQSLTLACSYWQPIRSLSSSDRTKLQAIGRLMTRKSDGFPICHYISESEARIAFREDEDRSLELWRKLYVVYHDQYKLIEALVKVNSRKSIALVEEIMNTQASCDLSNNIRTLLHNLDRAPYSIMEEPVLRSND